jgi:hypothetical protein
MKNKIFLWVVLILAGFCLIGCATRKDLVKDVPYTFAKDECVNGTATIAFTSNIRLVDYEGETLPDPERLTRWYPLLYPAGRESKFRVYVVYHSDQPGYRRRGIFICPPLENGKKYRLWYEAAKRNYYSGAGRLILTDEKVKELKYILGIPRYKQIHVQEIPPLEG